MLGLETVVEELLEQAVTVEDAVAGNGQFQGGAGVEEAGGQTTEATVAKGCVRLLLEHLGQVDAEAGQGLPGLVDQAEVRQVIEQGSSHEELGGEVVLLTSCLVDGVSGLPIVGNAAHDGG